MNAEIDAVRVAMTEDGPVPVVVLAPDEEREVEENGEGGEKVDEEGILPIFVGFEEAVSIARGMEAEDIGRPLTHDLTLDLVEELGGRVTRVVVSSLEDNTYIADLHVDTPRGETVLDARPSDSMALAVRTNAPVEVDSDVFERGQRDRDEFDQLQDIREVAELGA